MSDFSKALDVHPELAKNMLDVSPNTSPFEKNFGSWRPQNKDINQIIARSKGVDSGRAQDVHQHHAYAKNGVDIIVDSTVGEYFKLMYRPKLQELGLDVDGEHVQAFIRLVESLWHTYAYSPRNLFDAEEKRNHTQMVRSITANNFLEGEDFFAAAWKPERLENRTCFKLINPHRIANPYGTMDSDKIKQGVFIDSHGAPQAFYVHSKHPQNGYYNAQSRAGSCQLIQKYNEWGRLNIAHIFTPEADGQVRGNTQLRSALREMVKLDTYSDKVLDNAIANAHIAMWVESELGHEQVFEALSGGSQNFVDLVNSHSEAIGAMYKETGRLNESGVNIPHLPLGSRINHRNPEAPKDIKQFTDNGLNYIAAAFGLGREYFTGFSESSFASARATINLSYQRFKVLRMLAPVPASQLMFMTWLEEQISAGVVRLPKIGNLKAGKSSSYHDPRTGLKLFFKQKDAWSFSKWLGAGRTMLRPIEDIKRIILELEAGLMTMEDACAELGRDYQDVLESTVKERTERTRLKLPQSSYTLAQEFAPEGSTDE